MKNKDKRSLRFTVYGLLCRNRTSTVHSTQYTVHARRGVTLIELLMTLIIGAIAMFALAIPFVADRAFWGSGKAQAESQRDAEMVMRAIAHAARQGNIYTVHSVGPNGIIQFQNPLTWCFGGGPSGPFNGKFLAGSSGAGGVCGVGGTPLDIELIDGVRSKVQDFTITTIIPNKLVRVHLEVTHEAIVGSGRQENEILETEIFLRNGS